MMLLCSPTVKLLFMLTSALGLSPMHAYALASTAEPGLVRVHGESVLRQVPLYGQVKSEKNSQLQFSVAGVVEDVQVIVGQTVPRGEVLLSLNNQQSQQSMRQAQSALLTLTGKIQAAEAAIKQQTIQLQQQTHALALAQQHYDKQKRLFDQKIITKVQLEDAVYRRDERQAIQLQAAYQQGVLQDKLVMLTASQTHMQQQLAAAERFEAKRVLKAPFRGKISQLSVKQGQAVQAGESVLALFDADHMHIRAVLSHAEFQTVKRLLREQPSASVKLRYGKQTVDAQIVALMPESQSQTPGVDILLHVGQAFDSPIDAMQRFMLLLPTQEKRFTVPASSVSDAQFVVMMREDGSPKRVPVTVIGASTAKADHVLIASKQLPDVADILLDVTMYASSRVASS